jgi:hypothetical protein
VVDGGELRHRRPPRKGEHVHGPVNGVDDLAYVFQTGQARRVEDVSPGRLISRAIVSPRSARPCR